MKLRGFQFDFSQIDFLTEKSDSPSINGRHFSSQTNNRVAIVCSCLVTIQDGGIITLYTLKVLTKLYLFEWKLHFWVLLSILFLTGFKANANQGINYISQ